MNVVSGTLFSLGLAILANKAAAQDAIGNGHPEPRRKTPSAQECNERKLKADEAASTPGAPKLDRECMHILAKQGKRSGSEPKDGRDAINKP